MCAPLITLREANGGQRSAFADAHRYIRTDFRFATPYGLPANFLLHGAGAGPPPLHHRPIYTAVLRRRVALAKPDFTSPSLRPTVVKSAGKGLPNALASALSSKTSR